MYEFLYHLYSDRHRGYLGMMLYLGFRYSKASKSSDEFIWAADSLAPM